MTPGGGARGNRVAKSHYGTRTNSPARTPGKKAPGLGGNPGYNVSGEYTGKDKDGFQSVFDYINNIAPNTPQAQVPPSLRLAPCRCRTS